MTTADELVKFAKKTLKDKQIIIATQREPYMHIKTPNGIQVKQGEGGAQILVDGILRKTGGTLVAYASGDADNKVVDEHGRIKVPPHLKTYTLKRIFLSKKEFEGWYAGFANQSLWPLCHTVFVKPLYSQEWWEQYVKVNEKYAQAIIEEDDLDPADAFIWVHDYHLTLLPKLLKTNNPQRSIGTFWHIPWPPYEIFRTCPWKKEILEGLLGSDFIGFHRDYQVQNFLECVRNELPVMINTEPTEIIYEEHSTKVSNLPAGVDYQEIKQILKKEKNTDKRLLKKLFNIDCEYCVIGVDRVDYTKGIPERLRFIDRFLEKYPEFHKKFCYLQIGAPSRTQIPVYRAMNFEIEEMVDQINHKYSVNGWSPIFLVKQSIPRNEIFKLFRISDACIVSALDDGMNLVAKEYVICARPEKGMLLLSKFIGAAKDLPTALQINPYDVEDSADKLYEALTMKSSEKRKRMKAMQEVVKDYNIYQWGIKFILRTIEGQQIDI